MCVSNKGVAFACIASKRGQGRNKPYTFEHSAFTIGYGKPICFETWLNHNPLNSYIYMFIPNLAYMTLLLG